MDGWLALCPSLGERALELGGCVNVKGPFLMLLEAYSKLMMISNGV